MRLLTIGIGVSSAMLVAIQPQAVWQVAPYPEWFRWLQVASLAVPIAVGVCAPWQDARGLRQLNAATAVVSLLLVPVAVIATGAAAQTLLGPGALGPDTLGMGAPGVDALGAGAGALGVDALGTSGLGTETVIATESTGWHLPWLVTSFAPGTVAALIAWREAVAWALLALVVAASQAIRWAAGEVTPEAGVNDIQGLLTAMALVALSGQLLRAARENDTVFVAARTNEELRAAAAARRDAREQTAAFVHDEVLATLLLAARATTADLEAASVRQAVRATRLIRELGEREAGPPVSATALVGDLRVVMAGIDPDAVLTRIGDAEPFVPGEVATAIVGAVRQALVNSCAHAGPEAVRRIGVEARPDRVRVTVLDNGRGFDPTSLPRTRMGVEVSILGRMRGVSGGAADIDSVPGAGTCVTVAWTGAAPQTPAPPAPGTASSPATPAIPGTSATPGTRSTPATPVTPATPATRVSRGETALATAFVLGQVGLAGLGVLGHPGATWRAGFALLALLVAFALAWGPPSAPVSRWRAITAVASVVTISCLAWPASYAGRLDYAELWHLTGAAMVLVLLAVRGHPRAALIGTTCVGIVVAAAIGIGGAYGDEAAGALARALAVGYSGTLLVLGIQRVRRVTARGEAEEFERSRGRSWTLARRRELEAQAGELEALLGRQLERIADATPLDADERATCLALEGRLRDLYRSGRLARPPVVEAAMAARRRGVDVRLLDDAGHALDNHEIDRVARWLATHLEQTIGGQFTGRILPSGREGIASVVTDEVAEVLTMSERPDPMVVSGTI